jgi:hypothetical protein
LNENREALILDRTNSIQDLPGRFVDGLLDPYIVDMEV